ncbi:MAG: cyclic nucleotide-binding domain-containing protein [Rhizobiaceae bacterium]|nr:cyclic nucleotide-binding domain-containing protein [Rhizobiaceae bacterium]|tara:strand:+ start:16404 stop:16868 length:465 start_codon:yes stop_codon:yes gene_type:complete
MSTLKDDVAMLRRVALFSSVDPSKLKLIAYTASQRVFEDGEMVFEKDSNGTSAYLIVRGEAEILVESGGKQVVVAVHGRNALFGEISAFCDVPRTAGVRARGQLSVLELKRENLMELIHEFPEVAVEVIRELARRLATTTSDLAHVLDSKETPD